MTQLVDAVAGILGVHLPPWAGPAAVVVGAIVLLPVLYRNQSTGRARRVLTRAFASGSYDERKALEAEARALVAGNADGLAALADMAAQRGQYPLARELAEELRALGTRPDVVRRLGHSLDPDLPGTPEEARIRIERQRASGLDVAADDLTERARRRWPGFTVE